MKDTELRGLATLPAAESVDAQVGAYIARVDRWRSSDQKQRRVASALLTIEPRLRRIKGYPDLLLLRLVRSMPSFGPPRSSPWEPCHLARGNRSRRKVGKGPARPKWVVTIVQVHAKPGVLVRDSSGRRVNARAAASDISEAYAALDALRVQTIGA